MTFKFKLLRKNNRFGFNKNKNIYKKNLLNIFIIVYIFYLILSELKLIFIKYRKLRSA